MKYNRGIDDLQKNARMWWPDELSDANASVSIIPRLIKTQDDFLNILCLSKDNPYHVFEIINASKFSANLFLKHLCVLADYGGEPIQRLAGSFDDIFKKPDGKYVMEFTWNSNNYSYEFQGLPVKGLGNTKLCIDGVGLKSHKELTVLYQDMIVILMHGSTSTVCDRAGLSACEIGTLAGKGEILEKYVRERYINVSRITGGATANSLGQLAQQAIVKHLKESLGDAYKVTGNGHIQLSGYNKPGGMPFDVVIEKGGKCIGIEVSFQVTTNSTIERKSGQAMERQNLMHRDGHKIAYILDGAGNFQRRSAVSTICNYSDCTVAYGAKEFDILAKWIGESFD